MPLPADERDRRWDAARSLMRSRELDAILAFGDAGDVPAHQRYLSGYRSMYGDVATLLFSESDAVLVVSMPVVAAYAKQLSWIEDPVIAADVGGIGAAVAQALSSKGARRVGVAELARLPVGWRDEIAAISPSTTFMDVGEDLRNLRLVKSAYELELVKQSCRIASEAWAEMREILRPGRREFEVLADIEHALRSRGCEDAYNLVIGVPRLRHPIDALPSAREIEAGDALTIEISPRLNGYYAQLTALTALGTIDASTRAAYDAAIAAREAGLAVMRAGVDVLEVTEAVAARLQSDGYRLATRSIGHFCGLELDDLRAGDTSIELKAGMTFIFHPLVAGFPGLLRADTYLITGSGVEQLTALPLEPLEFA